MSRLYMGGHIASLSAAGEPSVATVVAACEAHRGGLTGQSGEKSCIRNGLDDSAFAVVV